MVGPTNGDDGLGLAIKERDAHGEEPTELFVSMGTTIMEPVFKKLRITLKHQKVDTRDHEK